MRVFVTGGTGLLGSAVVRALLRHGYDVVAQVRPGANLLALEGLPVEKVEMTLEEVAPLEEALRGCEGLFHVAGAAGRYYEDDYEYIRTNEVHTANLYRAARQAGIRRSVYTGTVAIPYDLVNDYARSKLRGAYAARREAGTQMEVIAVHPSGMTGPFDVRPTPLGKSIIELSRGELPAVLGGGSGFIHVDDAAEGHVAAFERGDPTRDYILTAEYWYTRDLFAYLADLVGVRRPWVIPNGLAHVLALFFEKVGRAFGFEPLITMFSYTYLTLPEERLSDGEEDRQALGLTYRPVRDAFAEAVAWFREHGYIES